MYRPRLEEMILGAVTRSTPNIHYIRQFRYPSEGGFVSYLQRWGANPDLRLNHDVTRIDPRNRTLAFANGAEAGYDGLVSSVPLPELVELIAGVPDDVVAAARKLACSSCVLVNIGVARPDIADVHISYFYDLDVVFPRTSYPLLLAEAIVPPGCGSVQVEIYFSPKYRPFTGKPEDYIERTVADLKRVGVLREDERILLEDAMFVPYANIIFDHDRGPALETINGYLAEVGIQSCGRFGEWAYFWTDDSFRSGEAAAERALESASRIGR
jgi:protoporphyrinogen oxidase